MQIHIKWTKVPNCKDFWFLCAVTLCWYLINIRGYPFTYCNLPHAVTGHILLFLNVLLPTGLGIIIIRKTFNGMYLSAPYLALSLFFTPLWKSQITCILSKITWVLTLRGERQFETLWHNILETTYIVHDMYYMYINCGWQSKIRVILYLKASFQT